MRRLVQSLSFALFITPLAATAQVIPIPEQITQVAAAPGVSFETLSDTKGTQLNSYLRTLSAELQRSFLGHLSTADAHSFAHQQVDLLFTIGGQGELASLSLASGTPGSPVIRAAWVAVKDAKYGPLPATLGSSGLTLKVHFVVA